ncbi:GNAT family N-acetyltransferase [Inhella sp.]|uniref:GNAT family N-acetyltransferase n=1 Tax=Inhella sp. TaxID=1921806 RepID=UPI0035AEB069
MTLHTQRGERHYTLRFDAIDPDAVHAMLVRAYWCEGIPRDTVARACANSLCAGLFCGTEQVGIARWVTDRATFAYLCDVFVHEAHRGLGLGRWLVGEGMKHPDLQGLRRQVLFTKDMQPLYAQLGFQPLATPERGMEIVHPNLYRRHAPLPAA